MSQPQGRAAVDLLTTAVAHEFLAPDEADALQRLASELGLTLPEAALRTGRLDGRQVEILNFLAHPADIAPGYELLDVIGWGGMGVVYRARQVALDRVVALKVLSAADFVQAASIDRFEREARAVGRLRHPNIVAAFDFLRHGGHIYLVMEYVEGVDLLTWIGRSGPLDEGLAWHLAYQMAAGLAHADKQNVVHRDLKPANMLLVESPEGSPLPAGVPMVKIADFGLALLGQSGGGSERLTARNVSLGTPPYMAPEQFDGRAIDFRTDQYGLGATVFHMLAGAPPYAGLSLPQLFARKMSEPPPPLREVRADITPHSAELVARLMATDPADRFASYAELLARLEPLRGATNVHQIATVPLRADRLAARHGAAQEATEALNSTATASPRPAFGLRRRRTALAAVLAGVLVLGLLGWWLLRPPLPAGSEMTRSGWGIILADPSDPRPWRGAADRFRFESDPDGQPVLAVTDGRVSRHIDRGAPWRELPHYALTLRVQPDHAAAVDLLFERSPSARSTAALHIEGGAVSLRRLVGGQPPETIGPIRTLERAADGYHEVRLERQARAWSVWFDGQELGRVPLSLDRPEPEIHFAAERGTARFRDLYLAELIPAGSSPPFETGPPDDRPRREPPPDWERFGPPPPDGPPFPEDRRGPPGRRGDFGPPPERPDDFGPHPERPGDFGPRRDPGDDFVPPPEPRDGRGPRPRNGDR